MATDIHQPRIAEAEGTVPAITTDHAVTLHDVDWKPCASSATSRQMIASG